MEKNSIGWCMMDLFVNGNIAAALSVICIVQKIIVPMKLPWGTPDFTVIYSVIVVCFVESSQGKDRVEKCVYSSEKMLLKNSRISVSIK